MYNLAKAIRELAPASHDAYLAALEVMCPVNSLALSSRYVQERVRRLEAEETAQASSNGGVVDGKEPFS